MDSHLYKCFIIPPYYDSLVAKIIVKGKNRKEAIARMLRALDETIIEGIDTNISLLQDILKNRNFIDNRIDTQFIKNMGVNA